MLHKQFRKKLIDAVDKEMHCYAIELCKNHLISYPEDAITWTYYGRSLTIFCRFTEAEYAFEQAAEYAFEQAVAHSQKSLNSIIFSSRGKLNERRGNYAEAEEWYLKAIEMKPEAIGNHIYLGVLLFRRGDLQSAEQRLQIAIEIGGNETDEAFFNLGGVLMAQERYEEARQCYLSAIELCPDYEIVKPRLRDVNKILKMKPKSTGSSVAEAPSE